MIRKIQTTAGGENQQCQHEVKMKPGPVRSSVTP